MAQYHLSISDSPVTESDPGEPDEAALHTTAHVQNATITSVAPGPKTGALPACA